MNYTHLTENERYMMSALRKQGISVVKIAKELGRNKRYTKHDFKIIDALIMLDWSPGQIVGYCRLHGYPVMTHELIWTDKAN